VNAEGSAVKINRLLIIYTFDKLFFSLNLTCQSTIFKKILNSAYPSFYINFIPVSKEAVCITYIIYNTPQKVTISLDILGIIKFVKVKKLFNLDAQIIYRQAFLYHEVYVRGSTCRVRTVRRNMAATP